MIKKILACSLAVISLNTYANNWDGPYIGASAGYVDTKDNGARPIFPQWTNDISLNGSTVAIYTGYNWQFAEKKVLGIEVSYSDRNNFSGSDYLKNRGVIDDYYALETNINRVVTLTARLGRLFNDSQSMLYMIAGLSKADVERIWLDDPNDPTLDHHSHTQTGWTAGIGVEHAFNDNLSIKGEYKYTDYGDETMDVDLWGEIWKQELSEKSLSLGLSYRF